MDDWQHVWREGIAPSLSDASLAALREELLDGGPKLCRGATVQPQPMSWNAGKAPEMACPVGYCGWRGHGLETVGEVEGYFARLNAAIDERIGEHAAGRHFYQFWDAEPAEQTVPALLAEVELEIARRSPC